MHQGLCTECLSGVAWHGRTGSTCLEDVMEGADELYSQQLLPTVIPRLDNDWANCPSRPPAMWRLCLNPLALGIKPIQCIALRCSADADTCKLHGCRCLLSGVGEQAEPIGMQFFDVQMLFTAGKTQKRAGRDPFA